MPKQSKPTYLKEEDGSTVSVNHEARRLNKSVTGKRKKDDALLIPQIGPWKKFDRERGMGDGVYLPPRNNNRYGN